MQGDRLVSTAIALICVIAILYYTFQFLRSLKLQKRRATPFDDPHKPYRLFVSYKSHDVFLVRRIVEVLLSQGLRIWFAEYVLGLRDRLQFEYKIRRGISMSDYGVIFLTERFSRSPHCCNEIRWLLEHLPPERILLVFLEEGVPTGGELPDLSSIPNENRLAASSEIVPKFKQCVDYIVSFISDQARVSTADCERLSQQFYSETYSDRPHQQLSIEIGEAVLGLNASGWREISAEIGFQQPDDYTGPSYGRRILRKWCIFRIGAWRDAAPADLHQRLQADPDDRELYEHLQDFADRYCVKWQIDCVGIHLFKHLGTNHLALTYWDSDRWIRRYSIMVPMPQAVDEFFEISLHFGFYGTFSEFCAAALAFESAATSIQWNPKKS